VFSSRRLDAGDQPAVSPFPTVVSLRILIAGALALGLVMLIWLMGSSNPYTPAGYVGYLTKGAVFGRASFQGTQRGPVSTDRRWLLQVTNVSVTPYTYTEDFAPRSKSGTASRPHTEAVHLQRSGPMGVPITGTFSATAPQGPAAAPLGAAAPATPTVRPPK
jgi:hypothetical protein